MLAKCMCRRELPELICGTSYRKAVQLEHMGVDLGRAQILMPQEFPDRADVDAVGQGAPYEAVWSLTGERVLPSAEDAASFGGRKR